MLLTTNDNRTPVEYDLQLLGLFKNAGKTQKDIRSISPASVAPQLTTQVFQACSEYLKTMGEAHEHALDKQVF